jgi:hypothetical protein
MHRRARLPLLRSTAQKVGGLRGPDTGSGPPSPLAGRFAPWRRRSRQHANLATHRSVPTSPSTPPNPDRRWTHGYDAGKPYHRCGLGKALCKLFDDTRAAFDKEAMAVPIANKIFRLLAYQRCMERAEEMGNLVLVGEMCERAAKEVGGVYTNKREMSGPSGGPIAVIEVPEMAKDMRDWVARYTPKSVHDEACEPTAS